MFLFLFQKECQYNIWEKIIQHIFLDLKMKIYFMNGIVRRINLLAIIVK